MSAKVAATSDEHITGDIHLLGNKLALVGLLSNCWQESLLQHRKRTVLVCYRVVDAELQKTGIQCEISSLIPVTGERQLLAQSRRKSGSDKCLLLAESSPCHSIQAQYPAPLHASAFHSSPAFCEAFCYSRCQQARRPGCCVFRAACLCRMKVLRLRHVTVCVSERQHF